MDFQGYQFDDFHDELFEAQDKPRHGARLLTEKIESLHTISGSPFGAASSSAENYLGRLFADLNYSDMGDLLEPGVHEYLDSL